MDPFEYEVAFSFLGADEPAAAELATLVGEAASVFIYSERQKEAAGKDGLELFSKVFGCEARVCVVFYREGWGETTWTRVEATAIKERGLEDGWEFLLVISLDGKAPKWLPRAQLWLNWKRFGMPAAVAVIERKVTERGGATRELSAVEQASLIADSRRFQEARDDFLHSADGVAMAESELDSLFEYLHQHVNAIRGRAPHLEIRFLRSGNDRVVAVASPGYTVVLAWSRAFANSLKQSSLVVTEHRGPQTLDSFREPLRVARRAHVTFTLDHTRAPVWIEDDDAERQHSTQMLAERYLKLVIAHAEDEPQYEMADPDDMTYDLR